MNKFKKFLIILSFVSLLTSCQNNTDNSTNFDDDDNTSERIDDNDGTNNNIVNVTSVSLNKTSLSLFSDESESLTVTILPSNATNKKVNWTSSNINVASVDQNGVVSALGEGNSTISVTTLDGNKTASCVVSVTKKISVESISVTPTSTTLNKGETVQLKTSIEPDNATNKSVTYKSSNTSVASVNTSGKVTAISAGSAVITVISNENAKSATSTITVNKTLANSLSLSESNVSISVGESKTITATILPSDVDNTSVSWESLNESVATVNNGVIKGIKEGNATIKATTEDGTNKSAQCEVNVTKPQTYELVSDVSSLQAGDQLIIASGSNNVATGSLSSSKKDTYLTISTVSVNNNKLTPSDDTTVFTLGGSTGNWTLADSSGQLLGAIGEKKLAYDSGTTTWTISISNGSFIIASTTSSFGRILYNKSNPRFSTYTTETNTSMLLPELYRVAGKVRSISLNANDIGVNVGSTYQLNATVSPTNVENKDIVWSSNDTSIASISSDGLVTGIKVGKTTITATSSENSLVKATCVIDVQSGSTIIPTSISLNKSNEEIEINETIQLTTTFSPSNVDDKSINWRSSNSSIASVDNNGLVTGISGSSTRVTITATSKSNTSLSTSCYVLVSEEKIPEWTLLFYICGANLESDSIWDDGGCATDDINEILSVANQPDDVNIVLECGGAENWKTSSINSHVNSLSRWHISNKKLIHDEDVTLASMGESTTLQSFLSYGFSNYKAKKYGVFMWNHGGAMDGCCFDELYSNDSLSNAEVYDAVKNARQTYSIDNNLEFIAYDACLMAVQDIAEYNSYNFNYMISSQESEYSGGYAYDQWLPTLYNDPENVATTTLLQKIGDTFMDYFEDLGYNDQTQSVLDLTKMNTYLEKFEDLAIAMKQSGTTIKNVKSKIYSSLKYGKNDYNQYIFDVFDVKSVLKNIKSSFSSLIDKFSEVENALDNVVVYSRSGEDSSVSGSCGLCLFCPISGYYNTKSEKQYILNNTHFTNWTNYGFEYQNL